jgi:hypothetical protein
MRILPVLILAIIAKVVCGQKQVLPTTNTSISQFTIVNTGTSDILTSISKINNNIFISGFNTYLAKSHDNCNTIIPVSTPVFLDDPSNRFFTTLRMDTNTIFMSYKYGDNWKFYKSIDGGNNWVKKRDSTHSNLFYVNPTLLFFDSSNAVVVFDNNRTILTTNALSTYTASWVVSGIGYTNMSNGGGIVVNDSTSIVGELNSGGAYKTKNKGKTWEGMAVYGAPVDFEARNKDSIYYVSTGASPDVNNYFGYTFDRGSTWSHIVFPGDLINGIRPNEILRNVCVKKTNEIYILGRHGLTSGGYTGNGIILKTTDLGQTWSKFVTPCAELFWWIMASFLDHTAIVYKCIE